MRIKLNPRYFLGPQNVARFTGLLRSAARDGITEIVVDDTLGAALVANGMAEVIDAEQPLDPEPVEG